MNHLKEKMENKLFIIDKQIENTYIALLNARKENSKNGLGHNTIEKAIVDAEGKLFLF